MGSPEPIIKSFLDDDLYKFTMCQAVCEKYPHARAWYKFINRGKHRFTERFLEDLKNEIDNLSMARLTENEALWLQAHCPFLTPVFIDFLRGYRYNPCEVNVNLFSEGQLGVNIIGPWYRAILWEVKLMAIISELYNIHQRDDGNLIEAEGNAAGKAMSLREAGINFADFGTRRRYSQSHHNQVVRELKKHGGGHLVGTSNMQLAMEYNLKPIGTQAHEWFMFHGTKYGYKDANRMAMQKWVEVFHGNLGIALSDTFTTDIFLKSFGSKYAKLFDGVRHDSGDPIEFLKKTVRHYERLHIDPSTKTIVFSDGLDPERAIRIANRCAAEGIRCSFGIGTNLTNDIEGVTPLNMVIKMSHCRPYDVDKWLPVVKLSDSPGKHTGNKDQVELCKTLLGT